MFTFNVSDQLFSVWSREEGLQQNLRQFWSIVYVGVLAFFLFFSGELCNNIDVKKKHIKQIINQINAACIKCMCEWQLRIARLPVSVYYVWCRVSKINIGFGNCFVVCV